MFLTICLKTNMQKPLLYKTSICMTEITNEQLGTEWPSLWQPAPVLYHVFVLIFRILLARSNVGATLLSPTWCHHKVKYLLLMPHWWGASKISFIPALKLNPCWPLWWIDWSSCWKVFTFILGRNVICFCAFSFRWIQLLNVAFQLSELTFNKLLPHSEYLHEAIRREIRLAREHFTGQALSQELGRIQKRLDSVELLSPDIVMSLLLSYRDIPVS